MELRHGINLAYCTNIHRGESWEETFENLKRYTLGVRDRVCKGRRYAIGLRLGRRAVERLLDRAVMREFRFWLEREGCYVFTINGFPYGPFHGTRVKEHVYLPDWRDPARLEYTERLFDVLAELVPEGGEGSVSTVPCSYKAFIMEAGDERAMRGRLWECVDYVTKLSERTGKDLHLGLEPEPLCYLETTGEAVEFFGRLREDRPGDDRLARHLGVNYDTCHLACEYESARESLWALRREGIRVSKLHLSSALRVRPTVEARAALGGFTDEVYFHQVIERRGDGTLRRWRDLDVALAGAETSPPGEGSEWRIHFHVPLHSAPEAPLETTAGHLEEALVELGGDPGMCRHLEMETYTWEVLPVSMKEQSVVEQLAGEYAWTLERLGRVGLVDRGEKDV